MEAEPILRPERVRCGTCGSYAIVGIDDIRRKLARYDAMELEITELKRRLEEARGAND